MQLVLQEKNKEEDNIMRRRVCRIVYGFAFQRKISLLGFLRNGKSTKQSFIGMNR